MSMKLSTRQVDGVTIVDCSGRITLGEGSVTLRDTVRDLLSKGNKKIILNLAEVNYIDSSGIGELVSAFTTTKEPGRRTEIAAPYQKGSRPATDHQALHRFRRQRRRSRSGQGIQITLLARHRWFGKGTASAVPPSAFLSFGLCAGLFGGLPSCRFIPGNHPLFSRCFSRLFEFHS